MKSLSSKSSAARGALLIIYVAAIVLMAYAFAGPVDENEQMTFVAVAMALFVIGAVLPANRSDT